jgi:hypothetical protein
MQLANLVLHMTAGRRDIRSGFRVFPKVVFTHQTYGNRKSSNPQSSILSSEDSSLRVRVTEFETYGIFKIDSSVLNPNIIINTLIFP